MKKTWIVLLIAIASSAKGQTAPSQISVKTTLCEIKAHPENFEHKVVEFSATASHGFEDSMVEDRNCRWNDNDNPGVWMDFGGTAKTDTMYCCGPTIGTSRSKPLVIDGIEIPLEEDDLFKQFNARLHPQPSQRRGGSTVRATLRGMMFVHQETENGRTFWAGYGHMGCCLLFVVSKVVALDPAVPKH
jgi:hypothetical protein